MRNNIRNIYQLRVYLQVQRIMYLLILIEYVKALKASGIINIEPITDGTVTFTSVEGGGSVTETEHLGNGEYQTVYTTGPVPAINRIEAEGKATITVPEIFYDSNTEQYIATSQTPSETNIELKSGQTVAFNIKTGKPVIPVTIPPSQKLKYTVYGVDVQLTIEPGIVLLNEDGYTMTDTTFRYNILPYDEANQESENTYNAIMADIHEEWCHIHEEWCQVLTLDKAKIII